MSSTLSGLWSGLGLRMYYLVEHGGRGRDQVFYLGLVVDFEDVG